MKKPILFIMTALTTLAFCACGQTEPVPEPTPEIVMVDVGGTEFPEDAEALDLSDAEYSFDALCAASESFTHLASIQLGSVDYPAAKADIARLRAAYPDAELHFSVNVAGTEYDCAEEKLDLSAALASGELAQTLDVLDAFPALKEINLIPASGDAVPLDLDTLRTLTDAVPGVKLTAVFELFGQTVSSNDESIIFDKLDIGDEGLDTLRLVMPHLNCSYFQISDCGIDYDLLAELRDEFPERNVVWRIYIYSYPFMTNCHRVRTVHIDSASCEVLKYCTEVRYLDLGHNLLINNCDFVAYMPHLQSAILGLTAITDISPLANCKELQFLELHRSNISDISVLSGLTSLEYLNIGGMPELTDLSPLFELTGLKVIRIVSDPKISAAQIEELQEHLPDTTFLLEGWAPHMNGWRYDDDGNMTEWYARLREQMDYADEGAYTDIR